MVAVAVLLTLLVVMVNVAVVAPAATVTETGTCAAALLLERLTNVPPVGAALDNVTVPVDELPPRRLVGFTPTESNVGSGLIVSPAVLVTPL